MGSDTGYRANHTCTTFVASSSAPSSAGAAPKRRRSTKNTPSVPRTPKTGGVASAPFTPIDWKRYAPNAGNRWKNSGKTRPLRGFSSGKPAKRAQVKSGAPGLR